MTKTFSKANICILMTDTTTVADLITKDVVPVLSKSRLIIVPPPPPPHHI